MFCHSCFPHTTYQRWIPCRSIPSFGFFLASFLAAPKSTQASSPFGLDFLCHTRSCVYRIFICFVEFDLGLSLHRISTASTVLCHLSQLDKGLLYAMRFPIQHLIACNWLRVPAFPRSNIPICTYLPLGVPLSLYAGRCL